MSLRSIIHGNRRVHHCQRCLGNNTHHDGSHHEAGRQQACKPRQANAHMLIRPPAMTALRGECQGHNNRIRPDTMQGALKLRATHPTMIHSGMSISFIDMCLP